MHHKKSALRFLKRHSWSNPYFMKTLERRSRLSCSARYILNCTPVRSNGGVANVYEKDGQMELLMTIDTSQKSYSRYFTVSFLVYRLLGLVLWMFMCLTRR